MSLRRGVGSGLGVLGFFVGGLFGRIVIYFVVVCGKFGYLPVYRSFLVFC